MNIYIQSCIIIDMHDDPSYPRMTDTLNMAMNESERERGGEEEEKD